MDEWIERARRLDASAIADAHDRLGLRLHVAHVPRLAGRGRLVGRVRTLELSAGGGNGSDGHLGAPTLDSLRPGDVVVVKAARDDCGAWGGLLSQALAERGGGGVIVDGRVRDPDEMEQLGIVVHARGATPVSARGRQHESGRDVPIFVTGVPVEPFDLVVADGAGCVFVRAAGAARVIEQAEAIVRTETEIAVRLRHGEVPSIALRGYERITQSEG